MGEDEVKGERELAFAYLKALEKKHRKYFKKARLRIMDCVLLRGLDNVRIDVIREDLPGDIRHDIEMIF